LRQKFRRRIHAALGLPQEALLRQLNARLRGWANYYRNGVAKATFAKLDQDVWRKLLGWVTRRHPRKSQAWKKHKYFSATGTPGIFSVGLSNPKGERHTLTLYRLASTLIERNLKIQGAANPYDPRYTEYFEKRRCFTWRVGGNTRVTPLAPITS
jgi:RNA-directed DNA polymerase